MPQSGFKFTTGFGIRRADTSVEAESNEPEYMPH